MLAASVHLFEVKPATVFPVQMGKGFTTGKNYLAPNPEHGAALWYWLKEKEGLDSLCVHQLSTVSAESSSRSMRSALTSTSSSSTPWASSNCNAYDNAAGPSPP